MTNEHAVGDAEEVEIRLAGGSVDIEVISRSPGSPEDAAATPL